MTTPHALVIDDDAYNVYIMERLLDQHNVTYTTVMEAENLLSILPEMPAIDIVFLDLEMPKLDGYEVLQLLREHIDPKVPIVACTVHTAELNITRKLGFSGFVAKPLDMERFSDQLTRILRGDPVWEYRY